MPSSWPAPASRPAARRTTAASWLAQLDVDGIAPAELVTLAHDPQTSGGLLAAIPEDRRRASVGTLDAAAVDHWLIGRVEAGAGIAFI